MTKRLIRIVIPVIFVILVFLWSDVLNFQNIREVENKARVKINNQTIIAEVVKDSRLREKGLSGRDSIGVNEGMLFLFDGSDYHTFWMKDMKFPIDIVWISGNRIAGINKNIQPEPDVPREELTIYTPPERIDKVLEIKASRSETLGLEEGDRLKFEPLISSVLTIN